MYALSVQFAYNLKKRGVTMDQIVAFFTFVFDFSYTMNGYKAGDRVSVSTPGGRLRCFR